MRGANRSGLSALALVTLCVLLGGCADTPPGKVGLPGDPSKLKSVATVRAERRAYDGAPPAIAREVFGMDCTGCHNPEGVELEGVGYAPPHPHGATAGMSSSSRCRQCHVQVSTLAEFRP